MRNAAQTPDDAAAFRLTDVLIASLVLAEALQSPEHAASVTGINAFLTVGVKAEDCSAILAPAEQQISLVHDALAS